jgi:uncharacterized membrane protein YdbT with pleckstrin-like domain
VLLLPAIPLLFFFNMMGNMMSQFSPQGAGFHLPALWFLLVGMDLFPALLVLILVLVAYLNCEITLTNKRLIYRTGFLVRAAGELPLENVEAMFILEPLLGRLLARSSLLEGVWLRKCLRIKDGLAKVCSQFPTLLSP